MMVLIVGMVVLVVMVMMVEGSNGIDGSYSMMMVMTLLAFFFSVLNYISIACKTTNKASSI